MAANVVEGELNAAGKRFAVVAARWHATFAERLLEGAIEAICKHGGTESEITVVRVPGSFEIALACKELASTRKFDGVIAVGALIKGETDHYQLIASELAGGLSRVMLETGVPVTFGVVTAEDVEQVAARSGRGNENKGYEAAVAAIEMANVISELRRLRT